MAEATRTADALRLHRLQQDIGDLGGESVFERLRRWRRVRSPTLSMAQVAHDPAWAEAFAREARRLTDALAPWPVACHHFGSSAIPGMASKPILDIALAVAEPPARPAVAAHLPALDYTDWGESPIAAGTVWYWRIAADAPVCALHLCDAGAPWLASALNFRDYLRAHPGRGEDYTRTKQALAADCGEDIAAYTLRKTALMYRLIAEADAWRARADAPA